MSNKKKILVLGYFGYETNQLDGQTIKTRNIYDLLKSKEDEEEYIVYYFDTQRFQKNKLNVLRMFYQASKCDLLIYLGAHNNLRYFFPILDTITRIKGIPLHYILVGGWLADFIADKPKLTKRLSKVAGLYPQTRDLTIRLQEEYGFKNVVQLNNFRLSSFVKDNRSKKDDIIKLIFMARVHPMKGANLLFKLDEVFQVKGIDNVSIDIYGPMFNEYESEFKLKIQKASESIKYKGILAPDKIHEILSTYDLMLFPTKYYTEGFPGTILDAYIAGIPVVATKWQYADEFVEDGVSGIVSEFNNDDLFINNVITLIENKDRLESLKRNIPQQAKKYSPETAWRTIKDKILS